MGKEIVNALIPDNLQQQSWYDRYLLLTGQMLAWSYLSDTGLLNESLKFGHGVGSGIEMGGGTVSSSLLQQRFQAIQAFRGEVLWQLAWSGHSRAMAEIPSGEVERLLESIATARRHRLLRYPELPAALELKRHVCGEQRGERLPAEVQSVILGLVSIQEAFQGTAQGAAQGTAQGKEPVYLPGKSSYSLATDITASGGEVYCEYPEPDPLSAICSLISDDLHLAAGDPVENPSFLSQGRLKPFNRGIGVFLRDHRYKVNDVRDLYGRFDPAFRQREMLLVQHMLKQCRGDFVLALPGAFLQKNTRMHTDFRRQLIDDGRLEGIIRLPSGLLPGRAQPLYLLVFRAEASDSLRLINADSEYFRAIPLKKRGGAKTRLNHPEVILEQYQELSNTRVSYRIKKETFLSPDQADENNILMDPGVYLGVNRSLIVGLSSHSCQPLSSGFDIIRAQAIKGVASDSPDQGRTFMEVTVSDINEAGQVDNPCRSVHIAGAGLKRAEAQRLQAGDILLVIKGQAGKLAVVPEICGSNWVAGQAFVILRQKPGNSLKSSVVLFRFLKSETGKKLIASVCTDGSVPFIHSRDLKNLPVPQWSDLEQEQACRSHDEILKLYARMRFFREKAEMIEREILKEA